jgi:hypothetical protein
VIARPAYFGAQVRNPSGMATRHDIKYYRIIQPILTRSVEVLGRYGEGELLRGQPTRKTELNGK